MKFWLKIEMFFVILLFLTSIIVFGSGSNVKIDEEVLETVESYPDEMISVIIIFDKKPEGYRDKIKSIGGEIKYDYNIIEGLAIKIPGKALENLKKLESLKGIYLNRKLELHLDESVPMISADKVHALGITGSGINVCVIDTGVDFNHSAIGLDKMVGCYHAVNDGADVGEGGCEDYVGHGTHVTGIITSTDETYKGVAPGSKIVAVRVFNEEGEGWVSDAIRGVDICVNNVSVDIISMSIGSGPNYPTGNCDDEPWVEASNNATDQGIAVVVSAGNEDQSGLSVPACGSKIIAVGAVDKESNVVAYSSKGEELDIVAPGHSITSCEMGTDGWVSKSGTSMAAPHISGVAALMLEKNSSITPLEIRQIFNETSDPVNKCYSCFNPPCNVWYEITCTWEATGAGIINASRAVDAAPGVWKYISITLIGYPVGFGNFDPGTNDSPAPNNGNYIIRIDPETNVNVNIYQKGDDYTYNGYILEIGNMTWNDVNNVTASVLITEEYSIIATGVSPGTDIPMYYWIDIPSGHRAGDYNTTIYIKANETSG